MTFALFMILEDLQKLVWGVQPVVSDTPVKVLGTVDVAFGADDSVHGLPAVPATRRGAQTLVGPPGSCVVRRRPNDRRRDGRPGGRAGNGDQRRKGHAPDVHGGRGACCVAGALASPTTSLLPGIGASTIVLSFAVVATAGLGQIEGAAITAPMIGLGRSLAVYFAPEFEVVVPYIIMVSVLLLRPQGLFAVPETRRI